MIQTLETPLGPMFATWTPTGLHSFTFASDGDNWAVTEIHNNSQNASLARQLAKTIDKYFESGRLAWPLDTLDWAGTTPFHQALLKACYAIPPGQTRTYGELAAKCGSPHAARAAGQAMARNRWPIIIPCHRVVGSTGKLTGYSGVGGLNTKQQLLQLEAGQSFAYDNASLSTVEDSGIPTPRTLVATRAVLN